MSDDKVGRSFLDALRNRTVATETSTSIPRGLRLATAYSWRLLVVAAAAGVAIWIIIQLKLLVIPLLIAILIAALLWPGLLWMLEHRVPRWAAIVLSVLATIAVISGLLWLAIWQISRQWASVQARTVEAVGQLRQYLIDGPLHLTSTEIDGLLKQGWGFLEQQASLLWSGALAIGSTVGHVATGALLVLFILLCILADGGRIWRWVVRLFPRQARPAVDGAGRTGWRTVVTYARTQLLVATIDATGIGLGALFLGVPLAAPIAVLVFLGAFIPFVGAVVTGALAVFLALVYNGPWIALWMLVIVLGVQQLEGHILQPLLMGSAVKVHPLAVVIVVAGGAMIAGIPGALFAVPLAAFVNVVVLYISRRSWETGVAPRPDEMIWSTVPRDRRKNA
ncbi:AI-2E family transporter [Microbacterium sp. AISO3]|jgi:putative heme transporter|uniref:PurR-regulated permease PerM n=2 Tax=Microbacterium TaxID=33882 RepID=A0ABU1HY67_9MICO|nr:MULTISPECIES: AI-2E family transporter [Microbacterium]APF33114.1 AI-2E family transporter [Microbacterium paludicola]MDR6166589.1 putative PurR-regulated permease PerM [Microbacterium paludicola]OAZ39448.1 AI-2E family transporter [Microbacterium arborescens]OWP23075.1 AI-2E family transporter [Microbacterium sp. AISO3]POX66800.1 AI-2E family transporter [Microbacterium sp. Ru50]